MQKLYSHVYTFALSYVEPVQPQIKLQKGEMKTWHIFLKHRERLCTSAGENMQANRYNTNGGIKIAGVMYSLPLGMRCMLLSRPPCGAMHVFLVHKASVGIV